MRVSKIGLIGIAALAAVGLAVGVAAAQTAPKVALVIGNAAYPDDAKPLAEPIKDARAIADELKRDGFDVFVGEDLTKQKMRAAVDGLKVKIKPGATAVLFFSGYGIQTAKQSYLIPVDAQIWTEGEVKRDGISIESILSEMNAAGANVKVVIIDAARRNPFERRFRGYSAGLASLNAPAGTLAIYSAAPDKVAGEASGDGSLFVAELLKEMRSPGLTAEEIFNHARINVSRASRNEQVPWVSSSLTEDFSFAGPSAAPRPLPPSERPKTVAPGPVSKAEPPRIEPPKAEAPKTETASAEELNKRGRTLAQNGDYAGADANFSEAIRQKSEYAEALNNRCWTRAVMGRVAAALSDCNEALRIRPNFADALDSRGLANLKLGNLDGAITDFDAALRLRPKLVSSLYGRGMAKLKKGLTGAGNADVAAAKALDPNIARDYAHYGME